ncbi:glycosyltransferase [Parvularcula dongshanensis]|uniref:Glycosyltransferase involved in cell wall biosynthesis n=1 Tax=Parvularcula dongshanensis TaxID=1173995 RepID=A0A840I3Q0_9PROT|nr:glycosyltransferase family 2 protein [Parvularcula dongshanensis]MBB4658955.1 glycosyltransferase involved in cell wall biosynthesis [Parvularcula dongshanensis]
MTSASEPVDVSIIFRSLNEERWLGAALDACRRQKTDGLIVETILVDSGSIDRTVDIAEANGVEVVTIPQHRFTFGRSLNWGCEAARGRIFVFISSHCIPTHDRWLANLIAPLREGHAAYVYGRQVGHDTTKFSEKQIFAKYFPEQSQVPQDGFFCNNANAAILKEIWENHRFDEQCTGLEDMVLAKHLTTIGYEVGYVAEAPVYHIHDETLRQTRNRYYREALTLRDIMPNIHVGRRDSLRYFAAGVWHDWIEARREKRLLNELLSTVKFRAAQFWGTYKGHNENRRLSRAEQEAYYYPRVATGERAASTAQLDAGRIEVQS